ncbi:uncharacterized protein [Macrobrachium rosenbergii]|uniref:uncharacterized protein n=1 Tax=Macrobrachium rosenbergii TaxID=79674 RepID=UPI0034D640B0
MRPATPLLPDKVSRPRPFPLSEPQETLASTQCCQCPSGPDKGMGPATPPPPGEVSSTRPFPPSEPQKTLAFTHSCQCPSGPDKGMGPATQPPPVEVSSASCQCPPAPDKSIGPATQPPPVTPTNSMSHMRDKFHVLCDETNSKYYETTNYYPHNNQPRPCKR